MKKGVPCNILGVISSQQNASPGQECRNAVDKARKLSLPGKAADMVDDIEAHGGIITEWLQEKCVDREEVFFMGYIDDTCFLKWFVEMAFSAIVKEKWLC